MQDQELIERADKDAKIRDLQDQLLRSKHKLGSAEKAEHLVVEMMDAGALFQEEDGSFSLKQE